MAKSHIPPVSFRTLPVAVLRERETGIAQMRIAEETRKRDADAEIARITELTEARESWLRVLPQVLDYLHALIDQAASEGKTGLVLQIAETMEDVKARRPQLHHLKVTDQALVYVLEEALKFTEFRGHRPAIELKFYTAVLSHRPECYIKFNWVSSAGASKRRMKRDVANAGYHGRELARIFRGERLSLVASAG